MLNRKAAVILSTYNGEKYIVDLLDSLACQTYPHISVFIRDDGSTDRTVDLIKEYDKDIEIHLEEGNHAGTKNSFFQLLYKVSGMEEFGYICFCDQDDIWKNDKIERAVNKIKENGAGETPVLYFSDYDIVNKNLEFVRKGKAGPSLGRNSFRNAVVQNIVPGFTSVINREAALLICRNPPRPEKIVMHDWWLYLVVSAFGSIVYDSSSTALYRRHGKNTMAAKTNLVVFWNDRAKRFMKNGGHVNTLAVQAREFKRCFAYALDHKRKKIVDDFITAAYGNLADKTVYAINGSTYYQSWFDNLLFKMILLFENRLKSFLNNLKSPDRRRQ